MAFSCVRMYVHECICVYVVCTHMYVYILNKHYHFEYKELLIKFVWFTFLIPL